MKPESKKLLDYIENTIGIQLTNMPNHYQCLPLCILDDIYSLQAKYESMTVPTVRRFANRFLNGDPYTADYSIDDFIGDLDTVGVKNVMEDILNNRQCVGGRRKIDVCYDLAMVLKKLSIQTIDDFRSYPDQPFLEYCIKYVKGVGDAAVNYLFMMAGDDHRVKPDIHIHHCIRDAIGHDVTNEECQELFREVSEELIKTRPYATPKFLDGLVWSYYSKTSF